MKQVLIFLLLSITFILLTYLLLFLPIDTLVDLTREDGIIENTGAILYGLAVVFFGISFARSKGKGNQIGTYKTHRNFFFFFLALLFFVAMGEEISWGQRIFGLETPEALKSVNLQGELNLHNITIVNGQNPDGTIKTGLDALLTSHRIFDMLVISLLFLLPLLAMFSPWARQKLESLGFPLSPLGLGFLTAGVIFGSKIFREILGHPSQEWNSAASEITEANFAFVVAMIGLYWARHTKSDLT